ncbi:MAG: MBL fold metallo-hydrolase [Clostridia bacterium]|nr:MBL fold metallo-hydrolase [Clostridia bacterium]
MYELIQASENCYYIDCPSKIGIIKINDTDVCLIDSGNNKDAGKKARKILDANGWTLKMILNTHSHGDHIGGNKYLQDQTNCKIYAPAIECDFTNHTILEPAFLFGAYPPKELRHKFLVAEESKAEYLTSDILPNGIEIINLPGHFFDMVGFKKDDVIYLADCLSSKATLDKYRIGVIYDVKAYLDTLEKVKNMKAKLFIPSHAEATEDITSLAQYNIDTVNEISNKILSICKNPITFEALLQKLFDNYNLQMSFEQYALVGSTVKSYLVYLKEENKINATFENNLLLYQSIEE